MTGPDPSEPARTDGGGTAAFDAVDPEVERRMIALLRQAGPGGRLRLMESLTATGRALSREAIRRRHPEWTQRQLDVEFIAVVHGRELADRLDAYLESRAR